MDRIIKDSGNSEGEGKSTEDYVIELVDKINEIIDWINSQ